MHKTVKGLGGLAAKDTMPCLVGTGQMQLFKGSSLLFFFYTLCLKTKPPLKRRTFEQSLFQYFFYG